jgi:hypothetical protein
LNIANGMMAANRRKEKSMLDGFLALFAAAYFHRQKIYSIRNERGLRNHLLYYNCSVVPLYTKISYLSCSKTKLNAKKKLYIICSLLSFYTFFVYIYSSWNMPSFLGLVADLSFLSFFQFFFCVF